MARGVGEVAGRLIHKFLKASKVLLFTNRNPTAKVSFNLTSIIFRDWPFPPAVMFGGAYKKTHSIDLETLLRGLAVVPLHAIIANRAFERGIMPNNASQ